MVEEENYNVGSEDDERPEITDIFIAPPECAELTDEDSGEEDGGGLLDNLNHNQLMGEAEAVFTNNARIGDGSLNLSGYSKNRRRKWIKGDLVDPVVDKPFSETEGFKKYATKSPIQLFELFFDHEVINLFIEESQRYASSQNVSLPRITVEEAKVFIGILILSGYNVLPSKKSYWDTKEDMKNILISKSMRRDRFLQLNRFIHFANNSEIDKNDKMFKLRPLTKLLKSRFLEHFVPCEFLVYDESMIRYFGPHPCKQFIRGKPIRFGYKVWSMNTSYGYLVNFEVYQGKTTYGRNSEYDEVFGKCTAPFISFLDELPLGKKDYPYHFLTDNLFTSLNLLKHLKERGYKGTGTLRKNRLPKDCELPSNEAMKKRNRGDCEYLIEKKDGIFIGKWKDNSVVTMASTSQGMEPTKMVKRFSQKEKKRILVSQPAAIGVYNRNMGGTDRMDQDVNQYRTSIRGKKWYWTIFTWLLDVSVNNAWQLYKKSGRKCTKLEFKREIVNVYLTRYGVAPNTPSAIGGSVSTSKRSERVYSDIRFDQVGHFLCETKSKKRRRCANEHCTRVVNTECIKCNVGLCIKCNLTYHSV